MESIHDMRLRHLRWCRSLLLRALSDLTRFGDSISTRSGFDASCGLCVVCGLANFGAVPDVGDSPFERLMNDLMGSTAVLLDNKVTVSNVIASVWSDSLSKDWDNAREELRKQLKSGFELDGDEAQDLLEMVESCKKVIKEVMRTVCWGIFVLTQGKKSVS